MNSRDQFIQVTSGVVLRHPQPSSSHLDPVHFILDAPPSAGRGDHTRSREARESQHADRGVEKEVLEVADPEPCTVPFAPEQGLHFFLDRGERPEGKRGPNTRKSVPFPVPHHGCW